MVYATVLLSACLPCTTYIYYTRYVAARCSPAYIIILEIKNDEKLFQLEKWLLFGSPIRCIYILIALYKEERNGMCELWANVYTKHCAINRSTFITQPNVYIGSFQYKPARQCQYFRQIQTSWDVYCQRCSLHLNGSFHRLGFCDDTFYFKLKIIKPNPNRPERIHLNRLFSIILRSISYRSLGRLVSDAFRSSLRLQNAQLVFSPAIHVFYHVLYSFDASDLPLGHLTRQSWKVNSKLWNESNWAFSLSLSLARFISFSLALSFHVFFFNQLERLEKRIDSHWLLT